MDDIEAGRCYSRHFDSPTIVRANPNTAPSSKSIFGGLHSPRACMIQSFDRLGVEMPTTFNEGLGET